MYIYSKIISSGRRNYLLNRSSNNDDPTTRFKISISPIPTKNRRVVARDEKKREKGGGRGEVGPIRLNISTNYEQTYANDSSKVQADIPWPEGFPLFAISGALRLCQLSTGYPRSIFLLMYRTYTYARRASSRCIYIHACPIESCVALERRAYSRVCTRAHFAAKKIKSRGNYNRAISQSLR